MDYFHSRLVFDPRHSLVWKEICRFLQKRYIPVNSRILDIGAGYCHFINSVVGTEKHALDTFEQLAEYAARDVTVHVQSCTRMENLPKGHFDVIFASNLFEHLSRDELTQTLLGAREVLKPGGRLLVLQPNFKYCVREYYDDYTHRQAFTHIGLCDLLRVSGFRICDVKPRILPFSMQSGLPASPFLARIYLLLPIKPFAAQMFVVAEKKEGRTQSHVE